jgi:hypothetical protein
MNIALSPDLTKQATSAATAGTHPGAATGEVLPWLERQTALAVPDESTAPVEPDAEGDEAEGSFSMWGEDGFDFWDVLDIINPLQHIPIVSSIYRELTGDEIGAAPRMAGGFLFGGPIGLAVSGANVAVEAFTGDDVGEHAIAFLKDAAGYGDDVVVAGAAGGGAAAQSAAAAASDPVALAQQSMAADSAGWARVQANAAAGHANAFSSANPFSDVVSAAPVQKVSASPVTLASAEPGMARAGTPNELGSTSTAAGAFTAKNSDLRWFPVNKPRNPVSPSARTAPADIAAAGRDVTQLRGNDRRSNQPELSEQQIKSAILEARVNARGMNAPATSFAARKAAAEAHAPTPSEPVVDKPSEQLAATMPRTPQPVPSTGSTLLDAQAQAASPAPAAAAQVAERSTEPDWFTQAMSNGLSKYQDMRGDGAKL